MLQSQDPVTPSMESVLAHIWFEILGAETASPETSFFDVGGNSLAAAELMMRVEDAYGEGSLPPDEFYARPTVCPFSGAVQQGHGPQTLLPRSERQRLALVHGIPATSPP